MQPLSDIGAAPSAMAREICESADVVSQIMRRRGALAEVARRLDVGTSPLVVLCGRGSSGHAGVFLRYLMETRLHLPVSASAPSVITAFRKPLTLRNALFLVISQSGRSPDLVAATRVCASLGCSHGCDCQRGAISCRERRRVCRADRGGARTFRRGDQDGDRLDGGRR